MYFLLSEFAKFLQVQKNILILDMIKISHKKKKIKVSETDQNSPHQNTENEMDYY